MAQSDGLARQIMDDCRQVHVLRYHHGNVCLQHLAQCPSSSEQNLSSVGVIVMFIQLTEDKEDEKKDKKILLI